MRNSDFWIFGDFLKIFWENQKITRFLGSVTLQKYMGISRSRAHVELDCTLL